MAGKKVTGIGGIFFKSGNVAQLKKWYSENLGIKMDEYGATFQSRQYDQPDKSHYLQWSLFEKASDYFDPSEKEFMINYRVADLVSLVEELKKSGVTICDEIQEFDYGKFIHIMDPDGNKIELWEPVDEVFDRYHEEKNKKVNK